MLGEAFVLVLLADHEPGDILQENQRNFPLTTELNEVGTFQSGFGE